VMKLCIHKGQGVPQEGFALPCPYGNAAFS